MYHPRTPSPLPFYTAPRRVRPGGDLLTPMGSGPRVVANTELVLPPPATDPPPVAEVKGTITVESTTPGAAANLDGGLPQNLADGGLHFDRVALGRHTIELSAAGYVPQARTVVLAEDGLDLTVDFGALALVEHGTIIIDGVQASRVRIDGHVYSASDPTYTLEPHFNTATPPALDGFEVDVAPGTHTVEFLAADDRVLSTWTVTLGAGATRRITPPAAETPPATEESSVPWGWILGLALAGVVVWKVA